jgi:hypothetical protein
MKLADLMVITAICILTTNTIGLVGFTQTGVELQLGLILDSAKY